MFPPAETRIPGGIASNRRSILLFDLPRIGGYLIEPVMIHSKEPVGNKGLQENELAQFIKRTSSKRYIDA